MYNWDHKEGEENTQGKCIILRVVTEFFKFDETH